MSVMVKQWYRCHKAKIKRLFDFGATWWQLHTTHTLMWGSEQLCCFNPGYIASEQLKIKQSHHAVLIFSWDQDYIQQL